MTIPNLSGNNAGNRIKIIQQSELKQNQVTEYQTKSLETVATDVDSEYSIEHFKKDYESLVYSKVLPELGEYDGERRKRLYIAILSSVILCGFGLYLFFIPSKEIGLSSGSVGRLAGLCFCCTFFIWQWLKKSFENKVKKKIMPLLMKAVPGFYWQQTPPVTQADIMQSMIIPKQEICSKVFDDCFVGAYRNVPVAISECNYSYRQDKTTVTVFRGAMIKIKMNKPFNGITVIRPMSCGDFGDLKKARLEEVVLEDPEFCKEYKVFSTDQIEARYLITTTFMERFKQISLAFLSVDAYCSFVGDSVYIGAYSGSDLFALCSLVKPVTNSEQFIVLFEEFASILALVDHFKLDKKLGL